MNTKLRPFQRKVNLANDLDALHTCGCVNFPARGLDLMRLLRPLTAAPLLCLVSACGSNTNGTVDSNVSAPVTGNSITSEPVASPSGYKIGTVLNSVWYYDGGRPFLNLAYGGVTAMASTGGATDI